MTERERWATRCGVIVAMAGHAIDRGNVLRVPVQVSQHRGAVMMPYFMTFLIDTLPEP